MIKDDAFPNPIIVDLVDAHAEKPRLYDLPFYYNGQLVETNFKIAADPLTRSPMGSDNGYQYLWRVAESDFLDGNTQITWLLDRRFYSVTSSVPDNTKIVIAEIGANDPNFNLRREPAFIYRTRAPVGVSFTSVIEPHGEYNPTAEYTVGSHSNVKSVSQFETGAARYVLIETRDGQRVGLGVAGDAAAGAMHTVTAGGQDVSWTGPYKIFHSQKHIDGGK